MAVRIDIPNIGVVTAENAATEETLRQLVAAINKANGTDSKAGKSKQAEVEASKQAAGALKGLAAEGSNAEKESKKFSKGWSAAGDAAIQSLKNLGVTATAVATKFITQSDQISKNPIDAGRDMVNTAIDVVADFGAGMASAIPVIGDFIAGLTKAAGELLKAANVAFAAQLKKNVDALQAYAKSGVSFAAGMESMQWVANKAGVGIKEFTDIVLKAKTNLNQLGLSGGEAAAKLSLAMGAAIQKGSKNLRDEMFKMGYAYEEQGELFAGFMANMQATGKLRSMSDREIAEGTRDYAKNLKVISDFTGQDAKKLMDKARAEVQQSAILAKLDAKQRQRYMDLSAAYARLGPEAENARAALRESILTGGTIVNQAVRNSTAGSKMVRDGAKSVMEGTDDVVAHFGGAMEAARNEAEESARSQAINRAQILTQGRADAASASAGFENAILGAGKTTKGQVERSGQQAEKMATDMGKLSTNTAKMYDQSRKFAVLLENRINKDLDKYAGLLRIVNEQTMGLIQKALGMFGGDGQGPGTAEQRAAKRKEQKETPRAILSGNIGWDGKPNKNKPVFPGMFAEGGTIGAGETGIAGESGPELITGPANVLSKVSTEKLITAIDAMRERKGVRFGENDFDQQVAMSEGRAQILDKRIEGLEKFNYKQLQAELNTRPEMDPVKQAMAEMMKGEDQPDNRVAAGINETNTILHQLVKVMQQTASHTAKVAMNTN